MGTEIHQFPAWRKRRCLGADKAGNKKVEVATPDTVDLGGVGTTMQPDDTRVVELLWGFLSNCVGADIRAYRPDDPALGQTEVQNTEAASAAQCRMARQDKGAIPWDVLPLADCRA